MLCCAVFQTKGGEEDYLPITFFTNPLFEPFDNDTRTMCFTVNIIDDGVPELSEVFYLVAFVDAPVPVQVSPNISDILILDDDGKCWFLLGWHLHNKLMHPSAFLSLEGLWFHINV